MKKFLSIFVTALLVILLLGLVASLFYSPQNLLEKETTKELGFTANAVNNSRTYTTKTIYGNEREKLHTFVAKEDIPTDGIDCTSGYGDAIKFGSITTYNELTYLFVEMDYSAEELQELLSEKNYKSVKFSYMIHTTAPFVRNACYDEKDIYSLLSGCGYHAEYQWDANNTDVANIPLNIWQTELISFEDFYKAFMKDKQVLVARIRGSVEQPVDFYFGSIEYVEEDSTTYVPYKGAVDYIPTEVNNSKACIRTSLGAGSFIYDTNTFIAKEDIPTDGIDISAGYDNAIKFSNITGQTYPFVVMNYTLDELKILLANCTGVKISFMVDSDVTVYNHGTDSSNVYTLLSACGYHGINDTELSTKCVLPTNTWQSVTIDTDDFYKAVLDRNKLMIARLTGSNAENPIDFYLGSIEFLMPAN